MVRTFHLGDLRVDVLTELNEPMSDVFWFFPNLDPDELERHRALVEPHGLEAGGKRLILPTQSIVARVDGLTILIDSCVGNDKHIPRFERWHDKRDGRFSDELAEAGLSEDDIDVVLCTHLHVDHIGWNTRLEGGVWVPTFPNARYLFSEGDFDHCSAVHRATGWPGFDQSILPIVGAGRHHLVADDHRVSEHVELVPLPGHTPHHCGVRLTSGADELIVVGDMIHSPLQCRLTGLHGVADADPELAQKTRNEFMARYADTDTVVAPIHFPHHSLGRLRREDGAYRFDYLSLEPD